MVMIPEVARSAMDRNIAALRAELLGLWRPIVEPPICEWIEKNLRFGPGDRGVQLESRSGPLTFADSPWWRFILECAADKRVSSIALPAATQTHKTTNLIIALALFFAEFRPAPGMIIVPDELEAKKIRDRIYTLVQESQKFTKFNRIRLKPEHKWNLQEIDLGSMVIHLAWAGSKQRTRGKPAHYVWMTEVDVYRNADAKAGDPVEAGKQRTKDVFRYKHFFESSPSEKPSTICDEEESADQRWRWFITCPHCGRKQEARFFTYKKGDWADRGGFELTVKAMGSDGASLMTGPQARKHAHYTCLAGCKIKNEEKQRVIEGGEWYPRGWKDGDPEPDRTPAKNVGFHLWAIHSPNETFGDTAEDYIRHLRKGRKVDFYGNRLAISYEGETRVPKWQELGRRAAWTHSRRMVPDEVWFLTAGIDKQGENNGARYVVRGWAPYRTSWLVDWGWIARDPSDSGIILSDLLEVERRVLVSDFQVINRDGERSINPLGRDRINVRLSGVDTNYLPMQIHRWMRQLPEQWIDRMEGERMIPGRLRAIRGDHKVSPDVRFRHNVVETNTRSGEKYEGGLHQWGICVYPYWTDLTDQISGEPGNVDGKAVKGSWFVTADALSQGREYLEQVTNWHYAIVNDPRKGKIGKWGPRTARIPYDFWACETYAAAMAEMVVGSIGWEKEAWEKYWLDVQQRKERKGKPRPRPEVDEIGAR